jgi:class 3 adenylate cyclase
MESQSLPGRIQVSAATRAALGDRFKLERRGIIEVKGKGMMETYFLSSRLTLALAAPSRDTVKNVR